MTAPRPIIKVKKLAVSQLLEIPSPCPKLLEYSSHSLAYEVIQPIKANYAICQGLCLLRWPTLSVQCVSLNKSTSYLSLFPLTEFVLPWDIKNMSFIKSWTKCMISIIRPLVWTFLVVQRLRIHLSMWMTWVRSLVQEDPTCHRATKPVCHITKAHAPYSPRSATREATYKTREQPHSLQLEKAPRQQLRVSAAINE